MRRTVPLLALLAACTDDAAPMTRVATGAIAAPVAAVDVGAAPLALDARGLPRLLRDVRVAPAPAATVEESAKALVARLAPAWRVREVPPLEAAGTIAVDGGAIVRLRPVLDGLPVDGGELRLLVAPGGRLRAASGVLVDGAAPRPPARLDVDASHAVARAIRHAYGVDFDPAALAPSGAFLAGADGDLTVELARARVMWRRDGAGLIPAWIVEMYASRGGQAGAWRTAIAGADGRVLAHRDLIVDAAFDYRAFADPAGDLRPLDGPTEDFTPHPSGAPDGTLPGFVAPALVSVDSTNEPGDPWLPAGATVTSGNNADVYTDPDGDNEPDLFASVTAPGVFDRVYDPGLEPVASQTQQMAALVQLWYAVNWLHDYWYDAGFTEAAGNAQADNYGRGGEAEDPLQIQALDNFDGGSRNNANMATPGDGVPPRMQVFVWDGEEDRELALEPSGRTPATDGAGFGPTDFSIGGPVLLGVDGAGADPEDGCEALAGVGGTIVLVDRGNCSFERKALNIQAAGGIGMILADNDGDAFPPFLANDDELDDPVTIPSLSVTTAEGDAIKADLLAGGVDANLRRAVGPLLDGALDASLVAHEFGHYVHHRLSDCGTVMCAALSEGWADFLALHLTLREGDDLDGTYVVAGYATRGFGGDPGYFGIRRVPYSVDRSKNALTYKHMGAGEALPEIPVRDNGLSNAEVHNAGEVWTSMLWEAYVALIRARGSFEEGRARMARYVVAGLLMAPPDANVLETRDAILAAADAADPADARVLLEAFASRGAGSCAVAPPRDSADFRGIVESFDTGGSPVLGTPIFDDGVVSCDGDGLLDGEETARITVPLVNAGHDPMTGVAVTLRSSTPGVSIAGATVEVGALDVGDQRELVFEVSLDPVDGAVAGAFELEVTGEGGCADVVTVPFTAALNVSDLPEHSTTDRFDTEASVWDTSRPEIWERTIGADRHWRGLDVGFNSDTALVSPVLTGRGDVTVTFAHRHAFEASDGTLWDGGVVEVTLDGGVTWLDASELGAAPGYTGVLTDISGNPLALRQAYGGQNPSYPQADAVTLDFGDALDGEAFQLRFRIGTDQAVGADGWEIDDVAFTGIEGTPFPTRVADDGCDGDDGGCCSAGDLGGAQLGGALGVLALVLRRRSTRRALRARLRSR